MNVGLIGLGRWGKTYLSTLEKMPGVKIFTAKHNYKDIFSKVECVIVATPAETHFQIVKDALLANKHVLVEKPFLTNLDDAKELQNIKKDLVLQIGHVYLFHDAISKIKEIIDSGNLGNIETMFSHRMNYSTHPNSLWEMGAHDAYILRYFFGDHLDDVKVMGNLSHCMINLNYKHKGCTVNTYIELSNQYYQKNKIREIVIEGSKRILLFDDEVKEPSLKICIKDKSDNSSTFIPLEKFVMPLEKQCAYFFKCVKENKQPFIGIQDGIDNIKTLETIQKLL
jgi:UDP-2-acetamido-3-amino-2,3-dideoxy-glucuronate N-acetyltransferase